MEPVWIEVVATEATYGPFVAEEPPEGWEPPEDTWPEDECWEDE